MERDLTHVVSTRAGCSRQSGRTGRRCSVLWTRPLALTPRSLRTFWPDGMSIGHRAARPGGLPGVSSLWGDRRARRTCAGLKPIRSEAPHDAGQGQRPCDCAESVNQVRSVGRPPWKGPRSCHSSQSQYPPTRRRFDARPVQEAQRDDHHRGEHPRHHHGYSRPKSPARDRGTQEVAILRESSSGDPGSPRGCPPGPEGDSRCPRAWRCRRGTPSPIDGFFSVRRNDAHETSPRQPRPMSGQIHP